MFARVSYLPSWFLDKSRVFSWVHFQLLAAGSAVIRFPPSLKEVSAWGEEEDIRPLELLMLTLHLRMTMTIKNTQVPNSRGRGSESVLTYHFRFLLAKYTWSRSSGTGRAGFLKDQHNADPQGLESDTLRLEALCRNWCKLSSVSWRITIKNPQSGFSRQQAWNPHPAKLYARRWWTWTLKNSAHTRCLCRSGVTTAWN